MIRVTDSSDSIHWTSTFGKLALRKQHKMENENN